MNVTFLSFSEPDCFHQHVGRWWDTGRTSVRTHSKKEVVSCNFERVGALFGCKIPENKMVLLRGAVCLYLEGLYEGSRLQTMVDSVFSSRLLQTSTYRGGPTSAPGKGSTLTMRLNLVLEVLSFVTFHGEVKEICEEFHVWNNHLFFYEPPGFTDGFHHVVSTCLHLLRCSLIPLHHSSYALRLCVD